MRSPSKHLQRILVLFTVVLATTAAAASSAPAKNHQPDHVGPAAALDWNTIAVATVRAATPTKFQVEGLIYVAYVQAAVYDAVTKIDGRYQPYHDFAAPVETEGASMSAAVAAAAYTTLAYYFPAQAGTLATIYSSYLAGLQSDGQAAGVVIGDAAAGDMIAFRTGDGRDAAVATPFGQGPLAAGLWVFAPPPSLQSAQTPWVAFMRPFMLESPAQFRPGPPPALSSRQWAAGFAETQAYGDVNSTVRTPEQTAVAQFWNANAINQANQTLRDLSSQHGFDLVETARALAMGNLVDADAGIACFDAKYHYTFWRPVTAIRNAQIDGNDDTTADPTWSPLLTTPNHPEYPAAHGCLTAADAEVYAELAHTHRIEVDISGATGGGTTLTTSRHYATAADLKKEIVDARVWAGLHYRFSGDAGVTLGTDVARWTLKRYFQPNKDD